MIVAGIGYRKAATLADLREAIALTGSTPSALATVAAKAHGAAMTALADALDLPVSAVTKDQIAGIQTATHSARIDARFGTGSLAEAVALVGAGYGLAGHAAQLTVTRVQSANGMATAAIAERIPQ